MLNWAIRKIKNWWICANYELINLWVDDVRLPPKGYVWATTAPEAIRILKSNKVWTLSLDHDLGLPKAGTGYDVACYLEAHPDRLPLISKCHSSNPVGREKIKAALISAKRRKFSYETSETYRSAYKSLLK